MPKILEMTAAVAVNAVGELGNKKKPACQTEDSNHEQSDN